MTRSPLLVSLALAVFALARGAAAQDCAQATACCNVAMAAMHQPPTACQRLGAAPAAVCPQLFAQFAAMARRSGGATPAACGGGTADPPTPAGEQPPPENPQPPGTPPPGQPGSAPPPAWTPGADNPGRSPSGVIMCSIAHVDGRRTILTGEAHRLELRCSNVNDSSSVASTVVRDQSFDHRHVFVQWDTAPIVGEVGVVLVGQATYNAPPRVNQAQSRVIIRARLVLEGANHVRETVTTSTEVRVINRHLHLDVDASVVTHCTGGATVTAGFNLSCRQGIDLDVGEDFAVHGHGGNSCGRGTWEALQSCVPQGQASIPSSATWSLDGAEGNVDPATGIVTLSIVGNRVGYPAMTFNGRREEPHAVSLFPRPLVMSIEDGATRSFGSPTTNASAGGVTLFVLHAR